VAYETILFEKKDNIAVITLNRPEKLNSITTVTMNELRDALRVINEDDDIKVGVITGAGEKAFSSGFDMELVTADGTVEWERLVRSNYDTLMDIWRLRKPMIAAVNGYAVAAGVSLALICDVVIASETAVFAEPEIRHFALSPLLILPWIGTNKKLIHYHYFTGDPIDAKTAESLGMAAKIVPADRLLAEAERMARRIAMVPAFPVQMTKETLRRTYEVMGMISALDYHRVMDTLVLSSHGIEEKERLLQTFQEGGIKAFLKARDGRFKE